MVQDPSNVGAANQLYTVLDYYVPGDTVSGAYTDCQKALAEQVFTRDDVVDWVKGDRIVHQCKDWLNLLDANGLNAKVPLVQLRRGEVLRIHGVNTLCVDRMKLFKQQGVITKLCNSCYKVQILPTNLRDLIRLYFLFKIVELPRDNSRKCMVELRERVPAPYKGYIFCESDEEARECQMIFERFVSGLGLSPFTCKITHGCSEFGLKYPSFKYSEDGSHHKFERPSDWYLKEAEFFLDNPRTNVIHREAISTDYITLREILLLRNWVNYANLIGDETGLAFGEPLAFDVPEVFAARVEPQSAMR
ncbi:MAG: hypothetical protein AAGF86_06995, partial [Pseudomonadota bacterium]